MTKLLAAALLVLLTVTGEAQTKWSLPLAVVCPAPCGDSGGTAIVDKEPIYLVCRDGVQCEVAKDEAGKRLEFAADGLTDAVKEHLDACHAGVLSVIMPSTNTTAPTRVVVMSESAAQRCDQSEAALRKLVGR